jgi:hypothetical protein
MPDFIGAASFRALYDTDGLSAAANGLEPARRHELDIAGDPWYGRNKFPKRQLAPDGPSRRGSN